MSGHSKWSTIKRKKEKTDGQRAKIFTKIGREIGVAVREGGPDPSSNSKLRDVIAKAKANNVPNDNIDRIIKKAAGEGGADNYEEIVYEGYGPCAVDFLTDEDVFDIRTDPSDFTGVCDDLEAKGYTFVSAEIEYVPTTYTKLSDPDDIKNMAKMLEMFEDNDDVQNVWHNWENADDAE